VGVRLGGEVVEVQEKGVKVSKKRKTGARKCEEPA